MLLPQLSQLLEEAEAYAGVLSAQPQSTITFETVHTALAGRPSVILPVPDGLMLVGKAPNHGMADSFRRALIRWGKDTCPVLAGLALCFETTARSSGGIHGAAGFWGCPLVETSRTAMSLWNV